MPPSITFSGFMKYVDECPQSVLPLYEAVILPEILGNQLITKKASITIKNLPIRILENANDRMGWKEVLNIFVYNSDKKKVTFSLK